jgi:hypothetical protein
VQDVTVVLEHVDLLHSGDRLNVELLERCLELTVVSLNGGGRLFDDLTTGSTLSACSMGTRW